MGKSDKYRQRRDNDDGYRDNSNKKKMNRSERREIRKALDQIKDRKGDAK